MMELLSVSRLQKLRSKRSTLWLAAVLGSFVVLFGCSRSDRPEIGSRLDSPIALASHPTLPVYYLLNASLSGEFQTGSLQAYNVPSSASDSSAPLETVEVPRLGTAIAVAKSAEFLIAGFSGSLGEMRIFNLDAQGKPTLSSRMGDRVVLPAGRIGSIQVNPVNGQSGIWSVVVSIADRSLDAKVVIFKYSLNTGFIQLAQLPSDFYTPSRDNALGNYTMAWGAPVVFPSLGLVAAFPQGTLGYFGKTPSAFEWLQGKVTSPNPAFDLRTVSAAAVDLNALVDGQPLSKSLAFVPIAFNTNAQKANPVTDGSAVGNVDYQFQVGFQTALALEPASTSCQLSGPFASLTAPSAVVVTNNASADVLALSGWEQVATQARSRLSAGEVQPLLGDLLSPSPISLTAGIASLSGIRTLVPSIQLINTGTICTISWLRIEQYRSSLGRELSRFQVATDATPSAQLSRDSDLTGMAAFTVNGQSVLAASFSNNKVQVLRVNGSVLDNVGVFNP